MKKRLIGIFLLLLLLLCFAACGDDDVEIDPNKINPWETEEPSLRYTLLDDGTYSVSVGDLIGATEIVIPESYEGRAVTKIGKHGFKEAEGLFKITIPSSVTEIGVGAFMNCISLETFTWPAQVKDIPASAFQGCELLREITVPAGVVSIGDNAFRGCCEIESITLPEGVVSIGAAAFSACDNLMHISVPSSLRFAGDGAFVDDIVEKHPVQYNIVDGNQYLGNAQNPCVVLVRVNSLSGTTFTVKPETTVIYRNALNGYAALTDVVLHDKVGSIGTSAFASCSNLKTVSIPSSVTSIGNYAFAYCGKLESVSGLENVTSIGVYAFRNCRKLTSVSISSRIDTIGAAAFSGCSALTFKTEDGIRYLGNAENPYVLLYSLTDKAKTAYTINASTRIIYAGAFSSCTNIESITVPDSVYRIMDSVFSGCTALKNVKISETAISLGNNVFSGCNSLVTLVIPKNIESIGANLLSGCSAMQDLSIPFVGANANGLGQTHFGYVFGVPNFDAQLNSTAIPASLHTVRVTACESISVAAFSDCKNIRTISLPATLRSLGKSVFSFCTGIKKVIVEDIGAWCGVYFTNEQSSPMCFGAQLYVGNDKVEKLVIPDSVTAISTYAFDNCDSIEFVTIGSGVKEIGSNAFARCDELVTVTMSDSVEAMGNAVFEKCKKLESVKLSAALINIGNSAFRDCELLATITLPEDLLGIGAYAFKGCTALTEVVFEETDNWYIAMKNFDVNGDEMSVRDEEENAELLKGDYSKLYWYRQ